MSGILAIAAIDIAAPATRVWAALTEPAQIKQYMFGSTIETDWRPSSAITWSGEYNGQRYQDRGQIVAIDPPRRLELTHFSPMSGAEDLPENYHHLTTSSRPSKTEPPHPRSCTPHARPSMRPPRASSTRPTGPSTSRGDRSAPSQASTPQDGCCWSHRRRSRTRHE